jgi:hypothetical protein
LHFKTSPTNHPLNQVAADCQSKCNGRGLERANVGV